MKTCDPAAYDEKILIPEGTQRNFAFRGLYFYTNNEAGVSISATITYNKVNNGILSQITKSILVNLNANESFLLPITGDGIIWLRASDGIIGQVNVVEALI